MWSYGFAYGEKRMKTLEKCLILCTAGNTAERLEQFGLLDSMKKVMFGDRLFNRIREQEFVVFDGMTRELEQRERNWNRNLETAYEKGKKLFASGKKPFSVEPLWRIPNPGKCQPGPFSAITRRGTSSGRNIPAGMWKRASLWERWMINTVCILPISISIKQEN